MEESFSPFPTIMCNVDEPNISPGEIVNIAPGESQILVPSTSEPNWEALAFPKDCSTGRNHFNEEREILVTPSKYVHARLKCCDDRFAANPQWPSGLRCHNQNRKVLGSNPTRRSAGLREPTWL